MGAVVHRLLAGASRPDRLGRLRRRLAAAHPLDFNRTFDSLLFVAGTGRSGTTWLADLLNADGRYRVIFEPFRTKWGVLGERRLPRYIRPSNDDPELTETVRRVLLARFKSNQWTARGNDRLISTRRIIKDVDSNLRLAWFRARFPSFPLVLIVRHPCGVAGSRARLGDAGTLDMFLTDRDLVADHLAPHVDRLRQLDSPFALAVARWCIETYVPLRQLGEGLEVEVVLYEQLVADPVAVVSGLLDRLGLPKPRRLADRVAVPSLTAYRPDAPLDSAALAVDEWTRRVSDDDAAQAVELLRAFGLDWLYGEDPQPRVAAVTPRLGAHGG